MRDRLQDLRNFLDRAGRADARLTPLAGDASRRRYFLVDTPNRATEIAMDAPRALGEDVTPFVNVSAFLAHHGFSAPEIYAQDQDVGFLLLEYFGEGVFDRICAQSPELAPALYDTACDVLCALAQTPPMDGLSDITPQMTDLAAGAFDWYAGRALGADMTSETEQFQGVFDPLIASLSLPKVTILRDYHAQNLIWLPERKGVRRAGLLDFQDAMIGPLAYDLVSLLKDARRDVSPEIAERELIRFTDSLGLDRDHLAREAAIIGVQRNMRILMIFARMSLHFARPAYVDLIPRVWRHIQDDLRHPDLAELASLVHDHLPAPTPDHLERLKDKCGTVPTLQ